jgi:hypothetical protein
MKIRVGFVSNSSTSSFICMKCGEIEAGMDCSESDFGMFTCENGHTLHESCSELPDDVIDLLSYHDKDGLEDYISEMEEEEQEEYNKLVKQYIAISKYDEVSLSEKACPVCQFKIIDKQVMFDYLIKQRVVDIEVEKRLIAARFKSYADFEEWVYKP